MIIGSQDINKQSTKRNKMGLTTIEFFMFIGYTVGLSVLGTLPIYCLMALDR
jgi:hypothetical protein